VSRFARLRRRQVSNRNNKSRQRDKRLTSLCDSGPSLDSYQAYTHPALIPFTIEAHRGRMSANDCQDCQIPSQPVLEESPSQAQTIGRAPAEVQMTSATVEVKSASGIKPDQSTSDSASGQNAEGGPSTSTPDILPPHTVYPNLIIEFCDRCRWYVPALLPTHQIKSL
jgi:hypothetical protein